jgi:hypothetical protein
VVDFLHLPVQLRLHCFVGWVAIFPGLVCPHACLVPFSCTLSFSWLPIISVLQCPAPHKHTQELLESGYLTEVHKFSKFIHGTCTLFPELVQVRAAVGHAGHTQCSTTHVLNMLKIVL